MAYGPAGPSSSYGERSLGLRRTLICSIVIGLSATWLVTASSQFRGLAPGPTAAPASAGDDEAVTADCDCAGIVIVRPQPLQRAFLPASRSATVKRAPHDLHANVIDIRRPFASLG